MSKYVIKFRSNVKAESRTQNGMSTRNNMNSFTEKEEGIQERKINFDCLFASLFFFFFVKLYYFIEMRKGSRERKRRKHSLTYGILATI